MEKTQIKNRKDQKIVVVVSNPEKSSGLSFVMHGLGGFKEQPHIQAFAKAFLDKNFTVVTFDTTNTYGESDGNYEDATTTNYYEDLEDVIKWAKTKKWYKEPFYLAGHSLGGISTALYAQKHPEEVKGLAPISTVVSGSLSMEIMDPKIRESWRETGWREQPSESIPGLIKRLKWSHMEDRIKYDLLLEVERLSMPVLLMVGDSDTSTPLEHQQMLYDVLPGDKEIHIFKGCDHNFREPALEENIKKLYLLMSSWIEKVEGKNV